MPPPPCRYEVFSPSCRHYTHVALDFNERVWVETPCINLVVRHTVGISPLALSRFAPSWSVEMTDVDCNVSQVC
jgi:hypothetical protein